jgi:hypothetical protein
LRKETGTLIASNRNVNAMITYGKVSCSRARCAKNASTYLDPADVVLVPHERPEPVDGLPRRAPRGVRDAERDERPHPVRPVQAEAPGGERAPVVRGHEHLPLAERVEERHQVADDVQRGVLLGAAVGHVGAAVPAHVGRHGAVPRGGQRRHLVAPGVPRLREAVEQQHRWRAGRPGLRHVHAHAGAQLHGAVRDVHVVVLLLRRLGDRGRRRAEAAAEVAEAVCDHRWGWSAT